MQNLNFTKGQLHVKGLRVFNKSYRDGLIDIHISVSDLSLQNKSVIIMPYDEFALLVQSKCKNEEVLDLLEEVSSFEFNSHLELMDYEYEKELYNEIAWCIMGYSKVQFKPTNPLPMQEQKAEYYQEILIEDFHGFEAVATAA